MRRKAKELGIKKEALESASTFMYNPNYPRFTVERNVTVLSQTIMPAVTIDSTAIGWACVVKLVGCIMCTTPRKMPSRKRRTARISGNLSKSPKVITFLGCIKF
jgi:hypothetical protein